MGISSSILNMNNSQDNYKLYYDEEKINVLFVHLAQLPGCNASPEQLNMLLGLNLPKYAIFNGTEYPYVFCVSPLIDIEKISREYGYIVGYSSKIEVFRYEFNSNYRVKASFLQNKYYRLTLNI